jgi:DNA-binding Lrp family transcriptional regulator
MGSAAFADLLLELRLVGMAPLGALAERMEIPEAALSDSVEQAVEQGWVRAFSGRVSGVALTDQGRLVGEVLLREELVVEEALTAIESVYSQFLPINQEILRICTDWQVYRGSLNLHEDLEYDRAVHTRLSEAIDRVMPLLSTLAAAQARFGRYAPQLRQAEARFLAGDEPWLLRPLLPSVHTVWFELHEHLLAVLGRSRSEERVTPAQ